MSKIPIVNLSIANTGYLKIGNAELNETELTRLLGLTGSSGSVGNGADGPTGPAGSDGINGADGAIGSTGPSGINGINGNDGAMGPTGPAGADSTIPGPIGPIGSTGPVGVGLRGPTGPYGGPMGPTGDKGDKGDQADIFDIVVYYDTVADLINDTRPWTAGKHALVALNNAGTASSIYINKSDAGGNIGYMNQWQFLLDVTPFVINGQDGATGPAGADGADGNVGQDGVIGPTGPVGPESTVAGPTGAPGQIGPTGEKGLDGVDGLIGATGIQGQLGPTGPPTELFNYASYITAVNATTLPDNGYNVGDYVLYQGDPGAIYRFVGTLAGDSGQNNSWQLVSYIGQEGTAGSQGPTGPNGSQGPTGFVDPNSDVNFNGNFTINNKTLYLNNSKLGINVSNPTSSLEIDGNTSLKTLFVSNDASMNSKLHVSNDFDVATNKFTVASASGDTVIAGNTTLSKTLSVIGVTSISDDILPATSTINLGNASNKFANVYTKNLFVDQNTINFQTDAGADAGSIAMAGGKLQVTDENAQSIDTIGLTDDGAGNKYLHNLDISGDLTLIHGDVSFNNNLFVNGDTSFNGDVHIIGNLKADKFNQEFIINTETTNYTLIVAEDLSLNNRLFIKGDASFNEDVYVKGNVNFDGTINNITTTEFGYLDGVTSNIQTQIDSKHPNINNLNRLSADLIHDGSVSNTKFGYLNGVTSDIQNQIDGKQPTINSSTRLDAGLIHDGSVSNTEFGYLNNVTSNIQTQFNGKQDNLTFGIADTNAVQIDGSSAADDKYARFTANGIEGRTTAELKSDIGLNNVTNESKSTMFSSPTFTGSISAPDNSIPASAISGDIGGGASTITYMTTSIYNSSSTDHQDKLFAAYANIDSSGYKQYYMSKLQKIDNNDYEWYYTEINPMGSKSITIDDTWGPNAPSISYSGSPFTITDGDSVNITSSNSGGAATWSISPALTNGLSLDANNGNITGTASGTLIETDYTITATNSTGTNTATIKITIEAAVVAPSISYSGDPFTFTDGDSVNITPSNSGGAVANWSINPAINNGLTFNTSTGNITGTASGTLGATGYTITATNSTGTSTVTITITIEAAAVSYPGISSVTYIPSDYSTSMVNGQSYFERSNNTDKFIIKLPDHNNTSSSIYYYKNPTSSPSAITGFAVNNTETTTVAEMPSNYVSGLASIMDLSSTSDQPVGQLYVGTMNGTNKYLYIRVPSTTWDPANHTPSSGQDWNTVNKYRIVYLDVLESVTNSTSIDFTYSYTNSTNTIPPLPSNYVNDTNINEGQLFIGYINSGSIGIKIFIKLSDGFYYTPLNKIGNTTVNPNDNYNSDIYWKYPRTS